MLAVLDSVAAIAAAIAATAAVDSRSRNGSNAAADESARKMIAFACDDPAGQCADGTAYDSADDASATSATVPTVISIAIVAVSV
jgi:hypothetical protein